MSKQSIAVLTISVLATAALTALRFVGPTGAHATAGGNAYGVTRSDTPLGQLAPVDILGTSLVEAGGEIAAGSLIEVGANGKAVEHDEGVPVARAAPGASAGGDGDLLEVILITN